MEIIGRQIRQIVLGARKNSLISKVMNGEAGARHGPPPFPQSLVQDEQRRQARLPVMSVDNFRLPRQVPRQVRHALGEENKALGVVRIIHAALLIQAGAFVKFRLMDKINGLPLGRLQRPDFRLRPARPVNLPIHLFDGRETLPHAPI